MPKLAVGDKYLRIRILGGVTVSAFKNNDKTKPNQPDYKGDGIAIWVRTKKAETERQRVSMVDDL